MLENLFGSKTRLKLLQFFFHHPEQSFYVRELARLVGVQINGIRREIGNLTALGVISEAGNGGSGRKPGENKRRYYCFNPAGILNQELQSLLVKAQFWGEKKLVEAIKNLGAVDYLVLSGCFTGVKDSPTDLLIVGSAPRHDLSRLVHLFEKEFGKEVRYTVMPRKEYLYRRDVADKFLSDLLEKAHIAAVDKIFQAHEKNFGNRRR